MKIEYNEFKKKDVIDVTDGAKLGRVQNLSFSYPQGKIDSIFVCPIGIKAVFGSGEIKLAFYTIVKVGEDAILVDPKIKPDCDCDCQNPCQNPCDNPRGISTEDYE